MQMRLRRWAERRGKVVHWGNFVQGHEGQSFEEEFETEGQAKKRERQALSGQAITENTEPIAMRR